MARQSNLQKSMELVGLNPAWCVVPYTNADGKLVCFDVIRKSDEYPLATMTSKQNFFTKDKDDDPHFMTLAWRLLNWARDHTLIFFWWKDQQIDDSPVGKPPAIAQRMWLETILEMVQALKDDGLWSDDEDNEAECS